MHIDNPTNKAVPNNDNTSSSQKGKRAYILPTCKCVSVFMPEQVLSTSPITSSIQVEQTYGQTSDTEFDFFGSAPRNGGGNMFDNSDIDSPW